MASNLKSHSIVYTPNKRNHEVQTNPPYKDICGKLWPFHAHIGKNISHDYFRTNEFGFSYFQDTTKTLIMKCRKRIAHPAGERCKFAGIYVKENGCLYIRGQHKHANNGKTPQNVGDDYVDIFGKNWKFNKEIGKNVDREIFTNQFGFNFIAKKVSGFYLRCRKISCKFAGIYLNSNGCLYTEGKHNHEHMAKNDVVGHSRTIKRKVSLKIDSNDVAKKIPRFSRTLITEKQGQEKGKEKPTEEGEDLPTHSATITPFSNNNNSSQTPLPSAKVIADALIASDPGMTKWIREIAELLRHHNNDATNVDLDSIIGRKRGLLDIASSESLPDSSQQMSADCSRLENRKRMETIKDSWTELEKALFIDGLKTNGKNFYAIANSIITKTVKECVKYYYDTKKIVNYKQILEIKSWWKWQQQREKENRKREIRKVMPSPSRIQKPAAGRKGKRI